MMDYAFLLPPIVQKWNQNILDVAAAILLWWRHLHSSDPAHMTDQSQATICTHSY